VADGDKTEFTKVGINTKLSCYRRVVSFDSQQGGQGLPIHHLRHFRFLCKKINDEYWRELHCLRYLHSVGTSKRVKHLHTWKP
jgi:hypothetical protein